MKILITNIVFNINVLYNIIYYSILGGVMNKDGIFSSNSITVQNLTEIADKQTVMEERRMCEISELASEAVDYAVYMLKDGYGIYEILSMISEGLSNVDAIPHTHSLSENRNQLISYLNFCNAYDKVIFVQLFFKMICKEGINVSEAAFLDTHLGNEIFTYVKNSLADEAYDVFSQNFQNPRVKYSDSLYSAARLVTSGDAEYALLPLEEHGGARLSTVAEILFKEDLKINSVTPVFGFEGIADMKYALVSKHFTIPELEADDDRYLEIRLRADTSISLSELFAAAEMFGCTLYRVNTISFETEDGSIQYYSVVFRDEGKDFSTLLIYLTLFSGAYTPIGIYKNLE